MCYWLIVLSHHIKIEGLKFVRKIPIIIFHSQVLFIFCIYLQHNEIASACLVGQNNLSRFTDVMVIKLLACVVIGQWAQSQKAHAACSLAHQNDRHTERVGKETDRAGRPVKTSWIFWQSTGPPMRLPTGIFPVCQMVSTPLQPARALWRVCTVKLRWSLKGVASHTTEPTILSCLYSWVQNKQRSRYFCSIFFHLHCYNLVMQ